MLFGVVNTHTERFKSWLGFVLVITRSSLKLMAAFTGLREDRVKDRL